VGSIGGVCDGCRTSSHTFPFCARGLCGKQSSAEVQKVFLEKAKELGFQDESKELFKDYANHRLRPDYFCKLNESGILIEVERGKTNQNNIVSRPYKTTLKHVGSFFEPSNYTNVRGLFLIGY
jgi:hypothetical protein